jgi:hypothetical protein
MLSVLGSNLMKGDDATGMTRAMSYVHELTFLSVIDIGNGSFTLRDVQVFVYVVTQQAHVC